MCYNGNGLQLLIESRDSLFSESISSTKTNDTESNSVSEVNGW
jgi:hypothetical protein